MVQPKIHLQGIGIHNGKYARDIVVGDTIVYNYGAESTVVDVELSKSEKTVKITTLASNGQQYTSTRLVNSIIGIKSI